MSQIYAVVFPNIFVRLGKCIEPEFRFFVLFAKPHVAVFGEEDDDDDDGPDVLSPDVQPGPDPCDP